MGVPPFAVCAKDGTIDQPEGWATRPGMVVADAALRDQLAEIGIRELMRRAGLSQHTLEAVACLVGTRTLSILDTSL